LAKPRKSHHPAKEARYASFIERLCRDGPNILRRLPFWQKLNRPYAISSNFCEQIEGGVCLDREASLQTPTYVHAVREQIFKKSLDHRSRICILCINDGHRERKRPNLRKVQP
jgi:hypothetical protein